MEQKNAVIVGSISIHHTDGGLRVNISEHQYELDPRQSLALLSFLHEQSNGSPAAKRGLPTWVYAMQELGTLPKALERMSL